jgi:hypothetical protein
VSDTPESAQDQAPASDATIIVSTTGTPFRTAGAAKAYAQTNGIAGYTIEQRGDGYAIRLAVSDKPAQERTAEPPPDLSMMSPKASARDWRDPSVKYGWIRVQAATSEHEDTFVMPAINGTIYQIQRGVNTCVPVSVIHAMENAVFAKRRWDPQLSRMTEPVLVRSYGFDYLGPATAPEYQAFRAKCRQMQAGADAAVAAAG